MPAELILLKNTFNFIGDCSFTIPAWWVWHTEFVGIWPRPNNLLFSVHHESSCDQYNQVIQTHLLFLGLGFCLCNNGTGLQVRGSYPSAYLTHCFYLCDMKRFSYCKAKLLFERKMAFFKLHSSYSLSPQPFLPLHTKQALSKPRYRKCYTGEWSLFYKRTFCKGFP